MPKSFLFEANPAAIPRSQRLISRHLDTDMKTILPAILLLLSMPLAQAAKAPTFATGDGAIRGYDPVAYFTLGRPTEGKAEFSTQWQGATWLFASAENLALFESDPARYAPRYGGYCAYAVSQGYTASIDPDAWSIVDGKLYLNYSRGVQKRWEKDIPGYISAADENWPGVLN